MKVLRNQKKKKIAAKHSQVVYDSHPDYVLVQIDLRNAFNELSRGHSMAGIIENFPALANWYKWAYGSESYFRLYDGSLSEATSQTGCRQGDPLSGLVFCLGFQAALQEIHERVHVVSTTTHPGFVEGLIAFMDDLNLFVHKDHVVEVIAQIPSILEKYGLVMNATKCTLIGSCVRELRNVPEGFSISPEGGICMGCPVGNLQYRQVQLQSIIDEKLKDLEVITEIHSCAAFNILRFCINTRISYVHRILGDIPELKVFFQRFDARVDVAIMRIIKFPDKHASIIDVSTLRSLPQARDS